MTRCLVTGAYGFIGRYLVHELLAQGFEVVGGGRNLELGRRLLPDIDWIKVDYNRDDCADVWLPRLHNIDVVINCVGILQSTFRDDADKIHAAATIALFKACAQSNVQRLIHISAMSAEGDVPSVYAASKSSADAVLARMAATSAAASIVERRAGGGATAQEAAPLAAPVAAPQAAPAAAPGDATEDAAAVALNWLIIKPSIVVAPGCHGGTSLIRALAGLPWFTPLPAGGTQMFQPIAMADLVRGLARLAERREPSGQVLLATGPETISLAELIAQQRRWLGFAPARTISIPRPLMQPFLWLGDALGYIGNHSAMRSTSMIQMDHQGLGDPEPFGTAAGLSLQPLAKAMQATPASVQDRMHARVLFPLALAHGVIALFWILSGLITLLPGGQAQAIGILNQGGLGTTGATIIVIAGAFLDIVLGLLFIPMRWMRRAGAAQLALSAAYLLGAAVLRPDLWLDPIGPMLKVLPLMAATILVMALSEAR